MATEFNTYAIYYHSAPQYDWQSQVVLYKDSKWVGKLLFIKDGKPLPANFERNGEPVLHFPESQFQELIEILRHERPLFIQYVPANGVGVISTSREAIGD